MSLDAIKVGPLTVGWLAYDTPVRIDRRKVELGGCVRPYGSACQHEHACLTEMILAGSRQASKAGRSLGVTKKDRSLTRPSVSAQNLGRGRRSDYKPLATAPSGSVGRRQKCALWPGSPRQADSRGCAHSPFRPAKLATRIAKFYESTIEGRFSSSTAFLRPGSFAGAGPLSFAAVPLRQDPMISASRPGRSGSAIIQHKAPKDIAATRAIRAAPAQPEVISIEINPPPPAAVPNARLIS